MASSFKYAMQANASGLIMNHSDITGLVISDEENKPLEWSITTKPDMERKFSPTFDTNYYPTVFSGEKTVNKPWGISISVGNMVKSWTDLVLLTSPRTSSYSNYGTLFGGSDYSRLLANPGQSMDSWQSSSNKIYFSNDIKKDVLKKFGVKEYELLPESENFPVRVCHFQGQAPLDVLLSLTDIPVAKFRFEGKKYTEYLPNYNNVGCDWSYAANKGIFNIHQEPKAGDAYNRLTVLRTESVPAREEFEKVGTEACGKQDISFSNHKYHPQKRVLGRTCFGEVKEWRWIDTNGTYAGESGFNGIAAGATFFFQQKITQFPVNAHWAVEVSGIPAELHGLVSNFDDSFRITRSDDTRISKYGLLEAPGSVENPLIPTEAWAIKHGDRKLREYQREIETYTALVPLNPWLRPGQIIKITEWGLNLISRLLYVTKVVHTMGENQFPISTLTMKYCPGT